MKNFILFVFFLFFLPGIYAQSDFPKNASEDKEKIMSDLYWEIWNDSVQACIDRDIEEYRKANATIELPEVNEGTEVKIEQVSHDFIFGASIFNFNQLGTEEHNQKYKDLFGILFNRATIPFYWKAFETEPDRLRFKEEYWDTEIYWNQQGDPKSKPHWRRPATDPIVDFCIAKGIAIHGHPLVWGLRKAHFPNWILKKYLTGKEREEFNKLVTAYVESDDYYFGEEKYNDNYQKISPDELQTKLPRFSRKLEELFKKRMQEIARHYGGRIGSWDVVNESAVDYAKGKMHPNSKLCLSSRYGIMPGDYTYNSFKQASSLFPDGVQLNINDYWTGPEYASQVRDLIKRGAKIDVIGSQMHLFDPQQCLDIAAGKHILSPQQVRSVINRLAATGLPVHLSEITITSPNNNKRGQKIQAVITRNLYRLWFSLEPMMGITWWNVVDGCGAVDETGVSGLFTKDMIPKQAYHALNELINHEWKTKGVIKVDSCRQIKFRGFRGNYVISWIDESGNVLTKEYYLK